MNNDRFARIWLCDCGRVHVETPHCRQSYSPAEFVALLRQAAVTNGTDAVSHRGLACYKKTALRATQPSLPSQNLTTFQALTARAFVK